MSKASVPYRSRLLRQKREGLVSVSEGSGRDVGVGRNECKHVVPLMPPGCCELVHLPRRKVFTPQSVSGIV